MADTPPRRNESQRQKGGRNDHSVGSDDLEEGSSSYQASMTDYWQQEFARDSLSKSATKGISLPASVTSSSSSDSRRGTKNSAECKTESFVAAASAAAAIVLECNEHEKRAREDTEIKISHDQGKDPERDDDDVLTSRDESSTTTSLAAAVPPTLSAQGRIGVVSGNSPGAYSVYPSLAQHSTTQSYDFDTQTSFERVATGTSNRTPDPLDIMGESIPTSSSSFNSYRNESDEGGRSSMLVRAKAVSDVEAIFEAQHVRQDTIQRTRIALAVLFLIACASFVGMLMAILGVKDDKSPPGDPRCWAPAREQSISIRCMCSDSLYGYYSTELSELQRRDYLWFVYIVLNHSAVSEDLVLNSTTSTPLLSFTESCHPVNQVLSMAVNFSLGDLDEVDGGKFHGYADEVAFMAYFGLMMVYVAMGGVHWTEQHGWDHDDDVVCEFFGLECLFVDVVHQMLLPDNNLVGVLPSELGFIGFLQHLDFSMNTLVTGTIPSELAGMTSLVSLDLSDCHLTGPLPSEIGLMDRLETLRLDGNNLNGTIPTHFLSGKDNFTARLPCEVATERNLRYLNLAKNQLFGSIPKELGLLSRLVWLRLQGNRLSGSLPAEMESLASLELLNLGNNNFVGTIPEILGKLPRLAMLNLHGSGWTGPIPDSFCDTASAPENKNRPMPQVVVQCNVTEDCKCCTRSSNQTGLIRVICFENVPSMIVGDDF